MADPKTESDPKGPVVATFNLVAQGYDKLLAHQRCASRLAKLAGLRSGMTVLDIATGTGSVAFAAAQIVGRAGRVLGVDLAKEMLVQARSKIAAAGLNNVELQEGDAAHLNLPDNDFDAVLCASSLHLLPDMLGALRDWQRVTKPGGLVAFSAFGATFHHPLTDLYDKRIRRYGVQIPVQRRTLRLADPATCRTLLQEAGLHAIEVQVEQLGYYLRTTDEWWDEIWYSGQRQTIGQLAPEALAQFKAEHLAEAAELATDQGIWLDAPVNFACGRKP